MNFIYKMLGRNNKWEFEKRIAEGDFHVRVYDIYKDGNINGLVRYKKILVNKSSHPIYNDNLKLLCTHKTQNSHTNEAK